MVKFRDNSNFIASNDPGLWSSRPSTSQHPAMLVFVWLLFYDCGVALECRLICGRLLVLRPCCSSFGDECSVQLLILCTESFLLVFLAVPNSAEVTVDCRLICG